MKQIHVQAFVICLLLSAIFIGCGPIPESLDNSQPVDRVPAIRPDYTDTVIPPNIAPLNFQIKEPGEKYCAVIGSDNGEPIRVFSDSPAIRIPMAPWKALMDGNRGGSLSFDVYVKNKDGVWKKYETIKNRIAKEEIDSYLAYRIIPALYRWSVHMGIYQRDLTSFEQTEILHNRGMDRGCMNCHAFPANSPDKMLLQIRSKAYGLSMILADSTGAKRIDTRTDFNPLSASYTAWHPSGKLAAFAALKVVQIFHAVGEGREAYDSVSDIGVYLVDENTVTSNPSIAKPDRLETHPYWSADGKYLYFCDAPQLPVEGRKNVKYNLARISYSVETGEWGEVETLLRSVDTGMSMVHPRVSPDNRYLLFCMCAFGNFSIFQPNSDLYLLDLQTGEYSKPDINSEQSESYHGWSTNGRWIVFSSKRPDSVYAKPHFSYFDENGKFHKPFVLPQEDPMFYDTLMHTYNVPEFLTGKVQLNAKELTRAVVDPKGGLTAKLDPAVTFRPMEGSTKPDGGGRWAKPSNIE